MAKYELTISTEYVPKWTYVEAIRELFQNAIDNETVNKENKMSIDFEDGKVRIANKTSKLTLDSLLLGCSTKRDDEKTIGQHGEGYKIAFMVLLREGKSVTVYNYGANEIWTTKIINSRRYNGAKVIQIEVDKNPIWKRTPDKDLTIEIDGISTEEWQTIKEHNLFLRDELNSTEMTLYGRALLDEADKGKIFVKGLYVCTSNNTKYGYDFHAKGIKLDRDRQLVDSFNISWYASAIWAALSEHDKYKEIISNLIIGDSTDSAYITKFSYLAELSEVGSLVLNKLKSKHGNNVYPVTDNIRYKTVEKSGYTPLIVSDNIESVVRLAHDLDDTKIEEEVDIVALFRDFRHKIYKKLDDAEVKELDDLIDLLEEKW